MFVDNEHILVQDPKTTTLFFKFSRINDIDIRREVADLFFGKIEPHYGKTVIVHHVPPGVIIG